MNSTGFETLTISDIFVAAVNWGCTTIYGAGGPDKNEPHE